MTGAVAFVAAFCPQLLLLLVLVVVCAVKCTLGERSAISCQFVPKEVLSAAAAAAAAADQAHLYLSQCHQLTPWTECCEACQVLLTQPVHGSQ
jgi:hypothetical protein